MPRFFFDTYALIEIAKNNPNYVQYGDELVTVTIFNLVELYYSILKDFNENRAKTVYDKFRECVSEVRDDVIFEAMKLKLKNKRLSYAGCVGYIFALRNNLRFLTSDREFANLDNVEFVK